MQVSTEELTKLREDRALWQYEKRHMELMQVDLQQRHDKEKADLLELVEALRSQVRQLEPRPASSHGASSSGVQPSEDLQRFKDMYGLAHLDSHNPEGWNILHLAAHATLKNPGMVPVIKELLAVLPTACLAEETPGGQPVGFTPLHLLCQGSDPFHARLEAIPLLIEAKAPLEKNNDRGATPLLLAAGSAFPDAVRALCNAKADINAANVKGKTAYDLAQATSRTVATEIARMGGVSGNPPPQPPEMSRADARAGNQPPNRKRRQELRNIRDGAAWKRSNSQRRPAGRR